MVTADRWAGVERRSRVAALLRACPGAAICAVALWVAGCSHFRPTGTYEYEGPPGERWRAVDFKVVCTRCEVRWGTVQDLRVGEVKGRGTFGLGVADGPQATTLMLIATPSEDDIRVQEIWIEVDGRTLAKDRVGAMGQTLRVQAYLEGRLSDAEAADS